MTPTVPPVPKPGREGARWIPFALLAALPLAIFVSSSFVVPSRSFVKAVGNAAPGRMSEQGFGAFWTEWWWLFVKGWHATEFGILFGLLRWAWRRPSNAVVAVAAAAFAAADEVHQRFVPGRGAYLSDWTIDLIGIAGAWGLWRTWAAKNEGRLSRGRAAGVIALAGVAILAIKYLAEHRF